MSNYYIVKNKYLAEGLAFLGFKYMKFDNHENGQKIYSFEDTKALRNMINTLISMKKDLQH